MLQQTSLIVDPPDGKIPYKPGARPSGSAFFDGVAEFPAGPEDRGLAGRCILWSSAGPPMLPTTYNSNFQLLQTPGYVVILNEMIHDVRTVPLDGRPHSGITSASGWGTHGATGTAKRWSSIRPISQIGRSSAGRRRGCIWSNASPASTLTRWPTSSRSTIRRCGPGPGPPRGLSQRLSPLSGSNMTPRFLRSLSMRVTRETTECSTPWRGPALWSKPRPKDRGKSTRA